MSVTRTQGLIALIIVIILLSAAITGYRTLILKDYPLVNLPEEESTSSEASVGDVVSSTEATSTGEAVPAIGQPIL